MVLLLLCREDLLSGMWDLYIFLLDSGPADLNSCLLFCLEMI